ncbi:hypothetical protein D8B26_005745 [Coccidioides posadasii str. Silveira]|uniref:uncharacterized protein n=1 Tax=Coccidioides posadasii (strain RMSCC 757 / Silveira) TaxID=443226 RepID=UPI001BEF7870|nr:hypothetical protein D8B26_005745 [Coccidioides posadasii str. Silveira]
MVLPSRNGCSIDNCSGEAASSYLPGFLLPPLDDNKARDERHQYPNEDNNNGDNTESTPTCATAAFVPFCPSNYSLPSALRTASTAPFQQQRRRRRRRQQQQQQQQQPHHFCYSQTHGLPQTVPRTLVVSPSCSSHTSRSSTISDLVSDVLSLGYDDFGSSQFDDLINSIDSQSGEGDLCIVEHHKHNSNNTSAN